MCVLSYDSNWTGPRRLNVIFENKVGTCFVYSGTWAAWDLAKELYMCTQAKAHLSGRQEVSCIRCSALSTVNQDIILFCFRGGLFLFLFVGFVVLLKQTKCVRCSLQILLSGLLRKIWSFSCNHPNKWMGLPHRHQFNVGATSVYMSEWCFTNDTMEGN